MRSADALNVSTRPSGSSIEIAWSPHAVEDQPESLLLAPELEVGAGLAGGVLGGPRAQRGQLAREPFYFRLQRVAGLLHHHTREVPATRGFTRSVLSRSARPRPAAPCHCDPGGGGYRRRKPAMTRTPRWPGFPTDSHPMARTSDDIRVQIRTGLGTVPDAVILFASARFEYEVLLRAFREHCPVEGRWARRPAVSSPVTATARASRARWESPRPTWSSGTQSDEAWPEIAARPPGSRSASSFAGVGAYEYPHRCALVMTDALAGHADELVEALTELTSGEYQFVGGGAGDDGRFQRTHVFHGASATTDAVVALEILSKKPIGVGVAHGWVPAGELHRVTEARGAGS